MKGFATFYNSGDSFSMTQLFKECIADSCTHRSVFDGLVEPFGTSHNKEILGADAVLAYYKVRLYRHCRYDFLGLD